MHETRFRHRFRLVVKAFLLGLLGGAFAAWVPAEGRVIVSEVMADPSALADAQGEFVELGNAGGEAFAADTLRLAVDGDTLALARVRMEAGAFLLLCRDSAAMAAQGVACHRGLPGLGLPNGRGMALAVLGPEGGAYAVPGAKAGVSWENTFAEDKGYAEFARSGRAFLAGDSATPGFRNSRSLRPAARDLRIEAAAVSGDGVLEVRVADLGAERAGGGLAVRADTDWDGTPDALVDSLEVPAGWGTLRVTLGPDHLGPLRISLGGDGDPAGNLARAFRAGGRTLEVTEVCPDPGEGPEWIELRNATGEGGGWARDLRLEGVELDGKALGPAAGKLEAGAYAVLTEDSAAFRRVAGPLKVRLIEPPAWPGLRNTGDTCRLSLHGAPLDSVAYGSKAAAKAPCLVRQRAAAGGMPAAVPAPEPTPGYPTPAAPARLSLRVARRVLLPGGALEAEVEAPPGKDYTLEAFDLEGNRLKVVGRGGAGRHVHAWDGSGPHGHRLPPGPYVLNLAAGHARRVREVVVVAGPR